MGKTDKAYDSVISLSPPIVTPRFSEGSAKWRKCGVCEMSTVGARGSSFSPTACLAVSAACLMVGAAGWLVNWLIPNSTNLDMLLLIGVYYFCASLHSVAAAYTSTGKRTLADTVCTALHHAFEKRNFRARSCVARCKCNSPQRSSGRFGFDDVITCLETHRRITTKSSPFLFRPPSGSRV